MERYAAPPFHKRKKGVHADAHLFGGLGDYALFTRPEMKVERVSYDVMTPSAARGLIEAIYWHPGLRWVIDCIHVCAPIRFTNLRRNEVKSTLSARSVRTVMERGTGELYLCTANDIQQRAALLLRDVHYVMRPILM